MAELDGPRARAALRASAPTRGVPARLWRRRQRPDRHRPRLAGPAAGRRLRVAARAATRAARRRSGREWFPLTFRDPNERWVGVNAAAPVLERFLDAELARRNLPPSALALVGFSQGTMMALHVGLRRAVAPAAIVGYSGHARDAGRTAPAGRLRRRDQRHGRRSCWSTATQDELIPVQALFHAAQALAALDVPVEWHVSAGIGHGIDQEGLRQGGEFLARRFG